MAGIFGRLGLADTDRVFNATAGQRVIYDIATGYVAEANAQLEQALSIFVEETSELFKKRYKLPGGGTLQRRGADGRFMAVKAYGYWDVAFPLEDYGAQIAGNDVDWAYMTVKELENHLLTVTAQNVNTVRWEVLHRLLDNVQLSFLDPINGTLAVEPLANGDTVVYPPVVGSESEATDNHYLESGYAAASISDSNNPFVMIRDELQEHFGVTQGGENIVVFINSAQRTVVEALTDFDEVPDRFIRVGDNRDVPVNLPNVPGEVIGRVSGCWVSVWSWVPANYMVGIHLEEPAPLIKRVDPADTGLGRGLQLVARDEQFPFQGAFWRHRFGFGTGNRLNGVVMELGTGGTYTVPTAYD